MGDTHYDNALRLDVEEHGVGEPAGQGPSHWVLALPLREGERALRDGGDDPLDLGGELQAETGAPGFVLRGGLVEFVQGIDVDDDRKAHDAESRRRTRARASDQDTASAVPRSRRARISASQASSHSGSAAPSTLSISSEAKRSRSAGSNAMASVVTTWRGWDMQEV